LSKIFKSARIAPDPLPIRDEAKHHVQLERKAEEILDEAENTAARRIAAAEREAASVIRAAEREAEDIRANLESETQQSRTKGHEEGVAAGNKAGRESASKEVSGLIEQLKSVIAEAHDNISEDIRLARVEITDLAIKIAEEIIADHIDRDSEMVTRIVEKAIGRAADRGVLTVRLNPEDLDEVKRHSEDIIGRMDDSKRLVIESDSRVPSGGCLINTEHGTIDARLERRLLLIRDQLLNG
jgi:flagellar assembly protein FliH